MGYYDNEGQHHSFRRGLERVAERIAHPIHGPSLIRHHHHHGHDHREDIEREREEVIVKEREIERPAHRHHPAPPQHHEMGHSSAHGAHGAMATVTIPCHHVRVGDLLMLQGRPCQVIRITTSSQTGQHRYLGVDLFTKQLHEESSFISNPSPSVYLQSMQGPVFKQYRVLDIRDDGCIVAMTEGGDVKQNIAVADQNELWSRISSSFDGGRGSIRVLVLSDAGRELVVDYRVIHGSRL
jgi:hypothetical protein